MSANATSPPHTEHTRLYLIRPPSSRCIWWNRKSCSSVAENSRTPIVTRPKEIAPRQIDLMATCYPQMRKPHPHRDQPEGDRTTPDRPHANLLPPKAEPAPPRHPHGLTHRRPLPPLRPHLLQTPLQRRQQTPRTRLLRRPRRRNHRTRTLRQ